MFTVKTPWNGDIPIYDGNLQSIINEVGVMVSENKALKIENERLKLQVSELTEKVLMMKGVMETKGLI